MDSLPEDAGGGQLPLAHPDVREDAAGPFLAMGRDSRAGPSVRPQVPVPAHVRSGELISFARHLLIGNISLAR